ncbi:hypothetical protein diail_12229, partial [Diaporthe ilicicola]
LTSTHRNRTGPSASRIYVADADGSNERPLIPANQSFLEYHRHFSPDGKYVTFKSEQEDGNADLYRIYSEFTKYRYPKLLSHLLNNFQHPFFSQPIFLKRDSLTRNTGQNVDGTGMTPLVNTPSLKNNGVLSPDGTQLAYVSTANGYVSNIWVMDLETGVARKLINTADTVGAPTEESSDGHYRPAWRPDGEWVAFSSDRNTGQATIMEHITALAEIC